MTGGLIDLHAHVLPGVDDGPEDLEAALALCRAMVAGGVGTVVATSHVSPEYPNRAATLAAARATLEAALATEGVPLAVLPGAEVALDEAMKLDDDELVALRLGGGPFLLAEAPLSPAVGDIAQAITSLQDRGHRIVIAHPERAPAFQRDPEQLTRLVADGALCAVTAGAVGGRFGRRAGRLARELLLDGMAHVVTSDAHNLAGRSPGLRPDLEQAARRLHGLEELIGWLCREAPAAVLAGDPLPLPPGRVEDLGPPREPGRGLLGRLRRR